MKYKFIKASRNFKNQQKMPFLVKKCPEIDKNRPKISLFYAN